MINKFTGLRFSTESIDMPLEIGQKPTEESRRAYFAALGAGKAQGNAGNALVAAMRAMGRI